MAEAAAVVTVKNLHFTYDATPTIVGVDFVIPARAKVILVGANGAGKSTLLRILTGKIFLGLESDVFDVCGTSTPDDQANGVCYLGGTWKRRRTGYEPPSPYAMDIAAGEMSKDWQEQYRTRRDELVRVLGINLKWRLHECSDGQRKKVRIMLKLLRPFQLCVIDEFAADLDIFSRKRFFDYLSRECEERGASVVYATHIFDTADVWASHVCFMELNKTLSPVHALASYDRYQEILARTGDARAMCPMYVLVWEELQRQYQSTHSDVFQDENQCIEDVIMDCCAAEPAADAHESARARDNRNQLQSGRIVRNQNH